LLLNRIAAAEALRHEFEKDYERVKFMYLAWVLLYSGTKPRDQAESTQNIGLKVGETQIFTPSITTLKEFNVLLQKPYITLGFIEKEKP